MHGRPQQALGQDVSHANYNEHRMDRFSNSRCVSSHFYIVPTSTSSTYLTICQCLVNSIHKPHRRLACTLILAQTQLLHAIAVVQAPQFNGTKRRRLHGLNSRFDRMLQEVAWASHASNPSIPRRKRAYSSDSSSLTNHDLPKTPTEIEYGSTKLGISSVPVIPESGLPEAMLWGKPHSSPPQVEKTVDLVLSDPSDGQ
jgi:hypothetical protein